MDLRPGDFAGLGEIDDGRLGFVQADADDLEAGIVIGAIGRLQPRQLGDAGSAPGRPEVDQDVLAAIGLEADGASLDVLGRERRGGLADLVQPLQVAPAPSAAGWGCRRTERGACV